MNVLAGHPTPVLFAGVDSGRFHVSDKVFLNRPEILELLVEMTGQQQHGVFQLAFAALQRALAKITGHDRRADRDCRNEEYAAKDQPADRTAANQMSQVEGGGPVYRHGLDAARPECQRQCRAPPTRNSSTAPKWRWR